MKNIIFKKTGRDYDFIATIENENDYPVRVIDYYENELEDIIVPANDWVGLFADERGRMWVKKIEKGEYSLGEVDDE